MGRLQRKRGGRCGAVADQSTDAQRVSQARRPTDARPRRLRRRVTSAQVEDLYSAAAAGGT
jgi:hypothetical protein